MRDYLARLLAAITLTVGLAVVGEAAYDRSREHAARADRAGVTTTLGD